MQLIAPRIAKSLASQPQPHRHSCPFRPPRVSLARDLSQGRPPSERRAPRHSRAGVERGRHHDPENPIPRFLDRSLIPKLGGIEQRDRRPLIYVNVLARKSGRFAMSHGETINLVWMPEKSSHPLEGFSSIGAQG